MCFSKFIVCDFHVESRTPFLCLSLLRSQRSKSHFLEPEKKNHTQTTYIFRRHYSGQCLRIAVAAHSVRSPNGSFPNVSFSGKCAVSLFKYFFFSILHLSKREKYFYFVSSSKQMSRDMRVAFVWVKWSEARERTFTVFTSYFRRDDMAEKVWKKWAKNCTRDNKFVLGVVTSSSVCSGTQLKSCDKSIVFCIVHCLKDPRARTFRPAAAG